MSFKDPNTRLTEPELDQEKERARLRMVVARKLAVGAVEMTAMRIYGQAHQGLLRCRTEDQVLRIETAFTEAMASLQRFADAGPL